MTAKLLGHVQHFVEMQYSKMELYQFSIKFV